MAVVKMKRVEVLVPAARAEDLLASLQELGLLHLVPRTPVGEPPAELQAQQQRVRRLGAGLARLAAPLAALPARAATSAPSRPSLPALPSAPPDAREQDLAAADGRRLVALEELLAREHQLETQLAALAREEAACRPWGDLGQGDLEPLLQAGCKLQLRCLPRRAVGRLPACAGLVLPLTTPAPRGRVNLLVVSCQELPELPGDLVPPPPRPCREVQEHRQDVEARRHEILSKIAILQPEATSALARTELRLADALRRAEARAQLGDDPDLRGLSGWCPAAAVPRLRAQVLAAGGLLLLDDPTASEEPPVLLRNHFLVEAFEPLLSLFMLPKYREPDPTPLFAPFMGLFFGLCLGDAAYGVLLFVGATLLGRRLRRGGLGRTGQLAFRLLQILGLSTVVVGLLLGNVFGVQLYTLPAVQALGLQPGMLLFSLSADPLIFFQVAIGLGVLQLGFGLLLRIVLQLRRREWQAALGSFGWLGLMPGVGLLVLTGLPWGLVAALALVVLFKAPGRGLAARLGGGLWGLYDWGMGLFGDVMSYLRLFGLGLSSGILAAVVNQLAFMLRDLLAAHGPAGLVAGWLLAFGILLVGHLFNFVMSTLGSTIHSARLQFLEFFNKFFTGGGAPYLPFAAQGASSRQGDAR